MRTEVEITTLKDLMWARGLSRAELARRSGLSYRTVLYALGGKHFPSLRTVLKLRDVLEISLDDLVSLLDLKLDE